MQPISRYCIEIFLKRITEKIGLFFTMYRRFLHQNFVHTHSEMREAILIKNGFSFFMKRRERKNVLVPLFIQSSLVLIKDCTFRKIEGLMTTLSCNQC